jgi:lipoprotein-anchoring transpeptidase ErfK/SrfK
MRATPVRVIALVAAVALLLAACSGGRGALGKGPKNSTTTILGVDEGPVSTVAEAQFSKAVIYDSADAASTHHELDNPPGPYFKTNLVFLVESQAGDWLHVYLPVRPNGSMGWIPTNQVKLTQHNYRVVVETTAHRITVYKGWQIIDQEPVGIGTRETPTPGGHYYLKELLQPTNPNGAYGPYAYGLSGFSNELTDYAGGDGVIGIHGTNDPSALGKDVSHGCIRMSNAGITRLVKVLPLGVPVDIRG